MSGSEGTILISPGRPMNSDCGLSDTMSNGRVSGGLTTLTDLLDGDKTATGLGKPLGILTLFSIFLAFFLTENFLTSMYFSLLNSLHGRQVAHYSIDKRHILFLDDIVGDVGKGIVVNELGDVHPLVPTVDRKLLFQLEKVEQNFWF